MSKLMVKERPILFSGAMVRAVLDDRKTQTRRVRETIRPYCPYGGPGDRLWVREKWAAMGSVDHLKPSELPVNDAVWYAADDDESDLRGKWRPGIFMPRWASRITIEVKSVRVERLQEISEADASNEGLGYDSNLMGPWHVDGDYSSGSAVECFAKLWDSINGEREGCAWGDNPQVWVVKFERVEV